MNQLEAVLVAVGHQQGRALRTARYRHRRLLERPLGIVLWQLGSEPFAASAIGFGTAPTAPQLVVAGDPRNRDLAFRALLEFGEWFVPRFEEPDTHRVDDVDEGWNEQIPRSIPQVVVPNRANVEFIGRLGRRLAYLPTTGDRPAPPALVRLGQHLQFIARHADEPGQQLVVPVGEFVAAHWATPQTDFERSSLPSLEAFINPPEGLTGFEAAALAELRPVGPAPTGDDDERLEVLVRAFNQARGQRTDVASIRPLLGPIGSHYRSPVDHAWRTMWGALARERDVPEAGSVGGRWDADRRAYGRHMDWTNTDGRRRTRQTSRQAIMTMRRIEDTKARLVAQEALDDPIRMIPWLLDGKAIEGPVTSVDAGHREVARVRTVDRPLVTIASEDERLLPVGKELWWTGDPSGATWVVHATRSVPGRGVQVTLKRTSSRGPLPDVGDRLCFSIHHFGRTWLPSLKPAPPWPLRRAELVPQPAPIEAPPGDEA